MSATPDPVDDIAKKSRFDSGQFWALVAADTFDPIVERITALLSHDRRMVLIHRYVNTTGPDNLDIKVGLRLDTDHGRESIETTATTRNEQTQRHFAVHLAPGITGFGFVSDDRTEAQMRHVYDRAGTVYDQPVTRIHVRGHGTDPARDDLIEIEHWNEHRVCSLTTLTFQADWG